MSVDVVCNPATGTLFALGITSVTCTATDDSGNISSNTFNVTVQDTTAPIITITSPAATNYTLNQVVQANFTCTDLVGVTACSGTVSNGSSIDTSSLGDRTFTVTASDAAGNTSSISVNYKVISTSNHICHAWHCLYFPAYWRPPWKCFPWPVPRDLWWTWTKYAAPRPYWRW